MGTVGFLPLFNNKANAPKLLHVMTAHFRILLSMKAHTSAPEIRETLLGSIIEKMNLAFR